MEDPRRVRANGDHRGFCEQEIEDGCGVGWPVGLGWAKAQGEPGGLAPFYFSLGPSFYYLFALLF